MPRISVIVPVYNAGAYLAPCLQSIAAQTCTDLEVLLVENAGSDQSGQVCAAFARQDSRFRFLPQQVNRGAAGARAVGVSLASGEYLAFVDGDDLIHPQLLQTLLDAAEGSGLPVSCCRYAPFAAEETPAEGPVCAGWQALAAPDHLTALLEDKRVDYSMCNKLYRAGVLRPEHFDGSIIQNEDLLTNWLALRDAPGLAFADFVGYHYRQHPASSSHRPLQPGAITGQWQVARRILEDSRGTALAAKAQAFYYDKLVYLYSMIVRQSNAAAFEPLRQKLYRAIRAELCPLLRCPGLDRRMKLAALATVCGGPVYAALCRRLLTDRQN